MLLAVILFLAACAGPAKQPPQRSSPPTLSGNVLLPSPRLLVGRVVAVDAERKFAFVELAGEAPAGALVDGTELIARTIDLRETARIAASRYIRGRTLGTNILAGQPTPGDEVVWLAP